MKQTTASRLLLLLLTAFFCSTGFAQTIKGVIKDTADNKFLNNAVISILNEKDSTLAGFTRSNKSGEFLTPKLPAGSYLYLISYPKYADYADKVMLKDGETFDLGNIALTLTSTLLDEVVVRSGSAIRIKGDTTEFIADSFKVRDGATVEELFRALPGFQVNSKGEITVQGKKAQRVLVDGEEFFGDDPTIATQNIGAKAVDKVQIYEAKSEQDQLKGVGNGDVGKTIDIKLKASAKKGYFGKAELGSNFDNLHDAKAMFNNFKGNRKVSVYGTKSNTNTGSIGWEERNKLGIENDYEYDELTGYYYSFGTSDEFSSWGLRGLPNAYTAGALYSDKWKEGKQNLNISYLYNRLGTVNRGTTIEETFLKDKTIYQNASSYSKGLVQRHNANGKYEWKIDSLASIKYTVAASYKTTDNLSETFSNSVSSPNGESQVRDTLNVNQLLNANYNANKSINNVLTYKQMFMKSGRMFIATLRHTFTEDNGDQYLNAYSRFVSKGTSETTDQTKYITGNSNTLGAKFTYNEPISKTWNIVAEYSINYNKANAHQNTYNKDVDDNYTILNPLFSNNFDFTATSNTGSILARYISKKLRFGFGTGLTDIKLNLKNLDKQTTNIYNFTRFTPQANVNYSVKSQTNIGLSYTGRTLQPSISQLQPIINNANNLFLQVGNPDLKVGFNHNLSLNFNDYKVLSNQYMYANAGMSLQDNAITSMNTYDTTTGITTSKPININGNYSYWSYINWEKGGNDKPGYGFSLNLNGGRSYNYIDTNLNRNDYNTFGFGPTFMLNKGDKYNFSFRPEAAWNASKSSLRPDAKNNFWSYGGEIDGYVKLPYKFSIRSDIRFDFRQKTETFADNNNFTIWNAELSRTFLKNDVLKLSFLARDLFNQNIGFSRNINSNFMKEERYDRLSRYFMLQATYTFNKMPGK